MFRKQVCREGEKLFHVFEHGDGVLFLNRVGNDNAAHVEAVFIRKVVLQFPQPVAVPVAQFQRHGITASQTSARESSGTYGLPHLR